MALDEPYERETARPPISLHPAFPAIVALWFAALLGLGSLVLPAVLLDRMVALSGLASLIPSADPPLGFTARALIAVAAALVGAGLGVAVARRVARAHRPQVESRVDKLAAGRRPPISIKDEVGGQGVVNGESLPINRRRALAISEDQRPSDFLYRAPLPGVDLDAGEPDPFAAPLEAEAAEEPLELSDVADDEAREAAPAAVPDQDMQPETEDYPAMTDRREFEPLQPFDAPIPEAAAPGSFEPRPDSRGPRGPEPLPFSPPSLARNIAEFEPEPEPEPEPASELGVEAAVGYVEPADEPSEAHADWATAPLDGLGLVQLVQRLGSTIERRRELLARPAGPVAQGHTAPADFEPAPAEEAAQAMAAYFGAAPSEPATPPPAEPEPGPGLDAGLARDEVDPAPVAFAKPAFLRGPVADDEDDDEGAIPDFTLPLHRAAAPAPAYLAGNDDAGEEERPGADETGEDEESYSSLLELRNPFAAPKTEAVRIEEPGFEDESPRPAVVFPGQEESAPAGRRFDPPGKAAASASAAAPAAENTDAALRAALATLQRMSGAA